MFMKKVLSVVLAMLMVVSLATPSFAASKVPVAKIQTVAGTEFSSNENFDGFPFNGVNPKFVFGAEMSVDSIGADLFADFIADFEINFSEDVKAKLYGRFAGYEDGKWIEFPGEYIDFKKGNTDLLKTFAKDWQVTVSEIDTTVKNFYCALVVDPLTIDEEEFKANVGVVIYEKDDPDFNFPVKTTPDSVTEIVIEKTAPVAAVNTVAGSAFADTEGFEDFDLNGIDTANLVGAALSVSSLGVGCEDLLADFRINLSEDVKAKLYGKYKGDKWIALSDEYYTLSAGDVDLLHDFKLWDVTVGDVGKIGTFYCALLVDPATVSADFTATLGIITYPEGKYDTDVAEVATTPDSVTEIVIEKTAPVAAVNTVAGSAFADTEGFEDFPLTGLNTDCLVGAVMSVDSLGIGYNDLLADFRINLSEDVKAKLYGKFKGDKWIALSDEYYTLSAGDVDLLHNFNLWDVTVGDVGNIETFYCALLVDPTTVSADFTATLGIIIYPEGKYETDVEEVETTPDSVTEIGLAKPVMPVSTVTMVAGSEFAETEGFMDFDLSGINPAYAVGAVFEGTPGEGFDSFLADFELSASDDVKAKLYGKYGSLAWTAFDDDFMAFEGGKEYHLFKDFNVPAVSVEYVGDIGKVYCVFIADEATAETLVNVSVNAVIYDASAKEPVFIDVPVTSGSVTEASVGDKLVAPKADIRLIPGTEFASTPGFEDFKAKIEARNPGVEIDMNYVVGCVSSVADMGKGYDDSFVEYMLTLSDDVDAMFFGKYAFYDWQEASGSFAKVPAGTTAILSSLGYEGTKMTLGDAADLVGEFYCAFYINPETAKDTVTIGFETKLYEDASDYVDVSYTDGSVTEIETEFVKPEAEVVFVSGSEFANEAAFADFDMTGFEPEFVIGASVTPTAAGAGYENAVLDFNIKVAKSLKAKLYGKIDNGEWIAFDDSYLDFNSGDNYILGKSEFSNVKAADCMGSVLYCVFAVDPESVDGEVNVSLEPVIYDNTQATPDYVSLNLTEDSVNDCDVFGINCLPDLVIDGVIDVDDYSCIVNVALGNTFESKCDINKDGVVDVLDVMLFERYMYA